MKIKTPPAWKDRGHFVQRNIWQEFKVELMEEESLF